MTDSPRGLFDHQLTELRDGIVLLGSMVEGAIEQAIESLKQQDKDLARKVIAEDETINALTSLAWPRLLGR